MRYQIGMKAIWEELQHVISCKAYLKRCGRYLVVPI